MECYLSSLSGVNMEFSAELCSLASQDTQSHILASAYSKWTMFVKGIHYFKCFARNFTVFVTWFLKA